ncbi:hypothetical protein LA303_11555 [Candidatus Sulfidibacterium hydrothermale]|uniref:hypothetical protein n=1 Tax=Candidatus Sulfidibacterium hydrothermale TaxID=2875962 RepID=UPI001F0B204A|nr:hypothetical protein [Candidatus Sulfidibacterium hydrothermale]UBM62026.1 hypothetical protein LA303_11555 [Candidatus Sulfidibacterium hydrothermale]
MSGHKIPVFIVKMTDTQITYTVPGDSSHTETTCALKYLKAVIRDQSAERAAPFRKANTIIIETRQTDSTNFHDFQRQLLKKDYFVAKANPQLLTLVTAEHALKKHPGWSYTYFFRIIFQDGKIIIKPYMKGNISLILGSVKTENQAFRWHYASVHSNIQYMIWKDIMDLVSDYPHTGVMYAQR